MSPLTNCIKNKDTKTNPIWLMRQAGRYLSEFREIRSKNQDFIELCLNETLVPEITLQPLKRFDLDAAIIFSDILMLHYGLGQSVKFKKDFGPMLGDINDVDLNNVNESTSNKGISSQEWVAEIGFDITDSINISVQTIPGRDDLPPTGIMTLQVDPNNRIIDKNLDLELLGSSDSYGDWKSQLQLFYRY